MNLKKTEDKDMEQNYALMLFLAAVALAAVLLSRIENLSKEIRSLLRSGIDIRERFEVRHLFPDEAVTHIVREVFKKLETEMNRDIPTDTESNET